MTTKVVIKSGTYTGDGSNNRQINCGFRPSYVCCWYDRASDGDIYKTECIDGSSTNRALMHWTNHHTYQDNRLKMYTYGFEVSDDNTDKDPNKNGRVYLYFAIGEVEE
ncbi:MAG: hypothetical protein ACTSR3_19690 [Candidatus Helarchaeota archaeon]